MAIADMFLKVQGVTGESGDAEHKGEIEVVSWSWGMSAPTSMSGANLPKGNATATELEIVKRVDQSSPTLMLYLWNHKIVNARLTVRKAGQSPLEYLTIDLDKAKITSLNVVSQNTELVERVRLAFSKVTVTYVPQDATGGRGAASQFTADASA